MKKRKTLVLILCFALIVSALAISISALGNNTADESKKINVWLIAGQSNAVGYGESSNYPDTNKDAAVLDNGIDNVLYYGKGYGNDSTDFVPVTFGLGKDARYSGAELGIATALMNSGEKHAIIKFADGDTQLSALGVSSSNNIRTWTPPSYIAANPSIAFEGDKIGDLYNDFIATVREGIAKLVAEGYTPVVQGFWWMQGERDGNHGTMTADLYAELLKTLIADVRSDVGEIVGADLSAMPAVYGRVYRNPAYAPNSEAGLAAVQAGQEAVNADETLVNVAMLDTRYDLVDPDTGAARDLVQQDGWHYDSLTQQMIGEAFVKKAYTLMGANYQHTTPVTIMNKEQALYRVVANYVPGSSVSVKLGSYLLFSISDSGLKVMNADVKGTYGDGDYTVYVCVNPSQNMTMVEVTLPDGGVVRKGAYNKYSGSSIVATATNEGRVNNVSLTYENLILNEYEIVTTEPELYGFEANVYNLVTTFTDATSTRHFAWTAKADFIGTRAMAIKYRAVGETEWKSANAYKLDEPTEYAAEDYFKADIDGLVANTEYEYKIGVKDSENADEWGKTYKFTTATGNEKEFTFIAVGDTQGITWGGTETANKGFMYTKSAFDEAFEEVSDPAFILHTGDVVEEGLKEDQWNLYFKALGEAGATVPHFATVGNHDDNLATADQNFYWGMHFNNPDNGGNDALDSTVVNVINALDPEGVKDAKWVQLIIKYMNETFYSYNYGDAHFIVYNSGAYSSQDELIQKAQRAWLKADLEANKDAKWTIVLSHQAVYHRYGGSYNRGTLADILEGFDVDLVIQGHSHLVTRSYPMKDGKIVTKENPDVVTKGSGTVYMLIGATALNHDRVDDYPNAEDQAVVVSNVGTQPCYSVFNVTENYISVTVKQVNGLVLDEFKIVEEEEKEEELPTDADIRYEDDFHYFTYSDLTALGIWEKENGGKYSASAPSYSSQRIKLKNGQSLQFNWLKYIGGIENYDPTDTYVFEFDAKVTSWGTNSAASTRTLYVAPGGYYNQVGLHHSDTTMQVGETTSHAYTYSGEETFRIKIVWCGKTITSTVTDSKGKTITGSRTKDNYVNVATDPLLQTMVFRCEDGETYIDNFVFSVYSDLEIDGYGTLPSSYKDASLYPIVLFQNGVFKGAYGKAQLKEALSAARGLVPSHTGAQDNKPAAQMLLRGDVVSLAKEENVGQAVGEIDINLNGYSITANHDGALFWLRTKTYSNEQQKMIFKVRNGTINVRSYLFAIGTQNNSGSSNMSGPLKNADIVFENVNIVAKRGLELNDSIISTSNGSIAVTADTTVEYDISFNNCVFDLSKVAANALIFNFNAEVAVKPAVTLSINGGEVKLAKNVANTKLYALNDVSTVTLGKGSDGEYLKFTAPIDVNAGALVNNTFYLDAETDYNGNANGTVTTYVKSSETAKNVTYSLQETGVKGLYIEGYGVLPEAYLDASKYPIVIFQNGEFKKAFAPDAFAAALSYPRGDLGLKNSTDPAPAKILLRGNATVTEKDENFGQTAGVIDINLNGFTLTQTHTSYLFYTRTKTVNNFAQKLTLNVYNGNIILSGSFFVIGTQNGGLTTGPLKDAELNFTDLNISLSGVIGTNNWFVTPSSGTVSETSDTTAHFDVTFNDCIFDLKDLFKANQIFQLTDTFTTLDFEINGGEMALGKGGGSGTKPYATKLYTLGANSSITFGKGTDGKYFKLTVPSDVTATIHTNTATPFYADAPITSTGSNGALAAFVSPVTANGWTTYTMQPEVYIEGYGTVTPEYSNPEEYPILVFQGGVFKNAFKADQFKDALTAAKALVPSHTGAQDNKPAAEILLLGDAVSMGREDNVGQAVGTIDINLNGHTLTAAHDGGLFWLRTKTYSNEQQYFVFKVRNGNLMLNSYIFTIGTQNNSGSSNMAGPLKNADIIFDNVNIELKRGTELGGSLIGTSNGSIANTTDTSVEYNITFNNCVFDLSGVTKNSVLFDLNVNNVVKAAVALKINGGEIKLSSNIANTTIYNINALSTVELGKGADGKWLTVTLPLGVTSAALTNNIFSTNGKIENKDGAIVSTGNECVFAKPEYNGTLASYSLYPTVMQNYNIKTSISLYSNFIYNIYVPASQAVSGIKIDGNALTAADYTAALTVIDGVSYYKISVPLSAKQSLRDVKITVALASGASEVNASWTVNVLKYAKSILAADHSAEEKALVMDMLSYARAAYAYFATATDADKIAEINALLGEGYDENNAPDMTVAPKQPMADRGFSDVIISLGDTPSYKFYLQDGFDKDDFTFITGGHTPEAEYGEDARGRYLEVYISAFRMRDDLKYTVTIDGVTYTESYNIFAYYNYVLAEYPENTDLHSIVERLVKYSESADAYRDTVINQ